MARDPKIVLHVDRLNSEGQGVGTHAGMTYFVDLALPGEKITGEILEEKRNYGRVALTAIETTSPERVSPPCPVFAACGGCQIMHLDYAAQLRFKRERVREALRRLGKVQDPDVRECVPAPDPFRYRNKLQFNVRRDPHDPRGMETPPAIGFFARGSHDVVKVADCLVHSPLGQTIYAEIQKLVAKFRLSAYAEAQDTGFLRHILLRSSTVTNEALVVFVTRHAEAPETRSLQTLARELTGLHPQVVGVLQNINTSRGNTILGAETRTLYGRDHLRERLLDLEFHVSARSFFQVNTAQAEALFRLAIAAAELRGDETVLDAYSGTGVLGLALARSVRQVIGIESNAQAVADAVENAKRNGIANARFLYGEAERLLPKVGKIDVALLDPPRKGCDETFLIGLTELAPRTIVYVSCDPATLGRDTALLTARGYELVRAEPVDMFPQTAHVECVALLRPKPSLSSRK